MRILLLNEARTGGGGVESYLSTLVPALAARGHEVALVYANAAREDGPTRIETPTAWSVADVGLEAALGGAHHWRPDVAFSHNMRHLEVDAAAASRWPLVKMMHGYFGTCISGHKAFGFPHVEPCSRRCGLACLALYAPRKCGTLRPEALLSQYTWTRRQQHLLPLYRALVVASEHMRHEYTAHGVEADRVHAIPLFTPPTPERRERATSRPQASIDVLFLGRMTPLKGADVLLDACAVAARHLGRTIHLVLAGEGPLRSALDRGRPGVSVDLPGWVDARRRSELLDAALIAAVPSRWPEPFGLVGLEGFAAGVPAVAFDVGGIATWLQDGINGRLVDPSGGAAAFGAALAAILSDPAERERLARGARDTASRFDVDRHTQALEHVLESARTR